MWGSFGLIGVALSGAIAAPLLGMQGATPAADTGVTIRRVPTENRILDTPQQDLRRAVVSPDGQWLAYSDDGIQIARYNLSTGQTGVVTVESAQVADLAWSPDSGSIAYVIPSSVGFTEIRLISASGGTPRVVARKPRKDLQYTGIEWSASERALIVQISTNKTEDFAAVSLDTGEERIFKSIEIPLPPPNLTGALIRPRPSTWILSADRRSITLSSWTTSTNRDIVSFDIDTGRETPLVRHAADDFPVAWTTDGRRLLFISDRERRSALWSAEFTNGKPSGAPVQVRAPTGTPVFGSITREGVLYLEINRTSTTDVYVSDWDPQSGRLTGSLMPAAERYAGFNSAPDWSPNGDRFIVQVGEPGNPDGIDLLVRPLPTGEERIIRPPMLGFSRPRFGPDARHVTVQGATEKPRASGAISIDLESGVVTPLVVGAGNPIWTRVGARLFYQRNGRSVLMLDQRIGATTEIYTAKNSNPHFNAAPSDNGDRVAVADGRSLRVINVESRASRTVLELTEPDRFLFPGSLAWTPDGRWLLFGKMNGQNGELWRISPEGGEPQFTGLVAPDKYIYFLRVRPDGRQIAFAMGDATLPRGEIWALRNFTK
jgi:Tol biopolymer transport system component